MFGTRRGVGEHRFSGVPVLGSAWEFGKFKGKDVRIL
jgi:hypothetical protein